MGSLFLRTIREYASSYNAFSDSSRTHSTENTFYREHILQRTHSYPSGAAASASAPAAAAAAGSAASASGAATGAAGSGFSSTTLATGAAGSGAAAVEGIGLVLLCGAQGVGYRSNRCSF